ncbi:MAG: hypothetical protein SPI74_05685 [Eubacterium sp.]|nr:hypothetical protein [Eubacterium sp.]
MGYWLSIRFSPGRQDIENNRTYMSVYLSIHASNGYYAEHTNASGTLNINGVDYPFSGHYRVNGSSQIIHSVGVWIPHNPDGSKTIYASASFDTRVVGVLTASNSATLTTIPRASSPTTSKSEITFGESFEIFTHRKSTTFTHDVYVMANNDPSTYTKIADKIPTDVTWTLPHEWKDKFPDSNVKLLVRVYTFNNNTNLGRIDAPLVMVKPSSDMLPDCNISVSDETENFSKYGGFVKGQSKLKITLNNTFKYGATLNSQSISINGAKYQSGTQTVDIYDSQIEITGKVTDSRNGTTTSNKTIDILDWHTPIIESVEIERCKGNGEIDGNGNYIKITYSVNIANLNNKNTKTLTVELKKQSEQNGVIKNIPLSLYKTDGSIILPCSSDYAWETSLKLKDSFEESTYTQLVGTGFTLMDFHNSGRGMAIGKVAEKNELLDVNLNAEFRKGFSSNGVTYDLNNDELQILKLITSENDVRIGKVLQTIGLRVPIKIEKNGQFEIVKYSDGTCEASCQITQITPVNMVQWNTCWWRWIGNLRLPYGLFKRVDNVQVSGHCNGGVFTCGSSKNTDVLQIVLLMPTPAFTASQVPTELPFVRVYGRYKD